MYSFAHDFISNTVILEINPKKCYLEPVDFLKYFYYSGIVYIAVKDFKSALECFDQVLSFPLDALSAVCIDAYKKATLVSLIHAGKAYAAPRYDFKLNDYIQADNFSFFPYFYSLVMCLEM